MLAKNGLDNGVHFTLFYVHKTEKNALVLATPKKGLIYCKPSNIRCPQSTTAGII